MSIETAQSGLDCSVLAALDGKTVILGVLDLNDPGVETADTVIDRVRRALPYVPADRLVLAPDCGMKYLPRDAAFGKLSAMAAAAAQLRPSWDPDPAARSPKSARSAPPASGGVLAPVACPLGVEGSLGIDAPVGVRAEVVPQALDQRGRQPVAAQRVVVRQRRGERGVAMPAMAAWATTRRQLSDAVADRVGEVRRDQQAGQPGFSS